MSIITANGQPYNAPGLPAITVPPQSTIIKPVPVLGPTGPAGPVGPTGPVGPAGPPGSIPVISLSATLAGQTITGATPIMHAGTNYSAVVTLGPTLFAAGESAVLQLKKNGVAVGGTITLNSALAKGTTDFSSTIGALVYASGDLLTLDITYTPGSTPNHPTFSLSLGWA